MLPNVPSKVWMKAKRPGLEYCDGVKSFLDFAKLSAGGADWYLCPCVTCRNVGIGKPRNIVEEHLICHGIMPLYTTWYCHGEPIENLREASEDHVASTSSKAQEKPRMFGLVDESFRHVQPEVLDACMNEFHSHTDIHINHEEDNNVNQDTHMDNKEKKLREDAGRPLYPLCRPEHTKLSTIVELVSMKSLGNWSDSSFNSLLEFLNRILPSDSSLPNCTRDCLEMIKDLGMNYETIHVCPNECILYWKEHVHLKKCPKCGENRYKPEFVVKKRGVPKKVLRYFPLTPRLRRLYSIPWIAKMMQWHSEPTSKSPRGFMRHPVDSSCWKGIDLEYPEFAGEPRNVRLGLSTDGFNPFGNNSLSYSCWPVMLVPYNLPPSYCMVKEFTMLSLLIPGRSSPGTNIDVYLQPLIEELNVLWKDGSTVYDSHSNSDFTMKAMLLWTIHDFPAYGYISGCKTSGKYACPICAEDLTSIWLKYGKKMAYINHRCFLAEGHEFRLQKSQFNGSEEHGKAPRRLSGDEVLEKVKHLKFQFGKIRARKRQACEETAWSKESILFKLPYWKILVVRNNLDVMHVEKNVAENLLATIMGTKNKTKDGLKARLDLKEMNIRRSLWPRQDGTIPDSPFELSKPEKEVMCQTLKMLKVPIGYSSNWFHNVNMEDLHIRCPKSHDYHIIIQQLLPVLLMHAYKKQKPLAAAIRQLSLFFNVLCSKVISLKELDVASRQIVDVLCVFEKYFPPSFFVSMTHLVVHLAEEARICGPVRYRWMYPFERMMRVFKMYVKNKRHPEGCIAERYLVEESVLYCMEYMPDDMKGNHKRGRKTLFDDADCPNEQPIDKKGKPYKLSNLQYEQARRLVVESSDDVAKWREMYQSYKQCHIVTRKRRRGSIAIERVLDFIPWLRQKLQKEKMSTLKRLVEGPSFKATSYKAYRSNGYTFCTLHSEKSKTTQNSGVTMKALTSFRSSARDNNLVEEEATYYGIIKNILELDYFDFKLTIFYCDWVRIEDQVNGYFVDPETKLTFVNFKKFKSNSKLSDEPFILASQDAQVFYCKDPTRDDWHVVLDSPKKLSRDIDAYEDPLVFEARTNIDASGTALRDEVTELIRMEE